MLFLFYYRRYLWQISEGGLVTSLVSGLDRRTLLRGLQTRSALSESGGDLGDAVRALVQHWRQARGANGAWACKLYLCEALCAANALAQFKITDAFLDGNFRRVASDGAGVEENDSVLPVLAECRLSL